MFSFTTTLENTPLCSIGFCTSHGLTLLRSAASSSYDSALLPQKVTTLSDLTAEAAVFTLSSPAVVTCSVSGMDCAFTIHNDTSSFSPPPPATHRASVGGAGSRVRPVILLPMGGRATTSFIRGAARGGSGSESDREMDRALAMSLQSASSPKASLVLRATSLLSTAEGEDGDFDAGRARELQRKVQASIEASWEEVSKGAPCVLSLPPPLPPGQVL